MRSELYNVDCLSYMKSIPDESVDVICTDPPYKYLDHKLDRDFDEKEFFEQIGRILKKGGWCIIFGRGIAFYGWNLLLRDQGLTFKEEIIWNKRRPSSSLLPLKRMHETIAICVKGQGKIRRVTIPYLEMKKYDINSICGDIRRMRSILSNPSELVAVEEYLKSSHLDYNQKNQSPPNCVTVHSSVNRAARSAECMRMITEGACERDIIEILPSQYKRIHPTEKPVRLIERLLNLVAEPRALVFDPFSGSGSCRIACHNLGLDFIGCEIDEEYYNASEKRYIEVTRQVILK